MQPNLLAPHGCTTKQDFLIDTGAEINVFPASRSHRLNKADLTLPAANNSSIKTYGFQQLTLNLGLPRPLTWRFVLLAIIGANFQLQYKLLVDLDQRRLADTRNGTRISADHSTSSPQLLSSISTPVTRSDPYTQLLREFPSLPTTCTSDTPMRHGVTHHIITTGHPASARARRFSLEKLASAKAEFAKLINTGIVRP